MGRYSRLHHFIEHVLLRKTILDGLLLSLPLTITGAIGLTIASIPNDSYQIAIKTILDGKLYDMMYAIFTYTFSALPLILILTMGFSFGKAVSRDLNEILYYPIVTFCSYLIFIDSPSATLTDVFNTAQTFISIVVTIVACSILYVLRQWKYSDLQFYIKHPSSIFMSIYKMLLPSLLVLLFFSFASSLFTQDLKVVIIDLHSALFEQLGINMLSFSLYVLMEHLYWFFGIHGSNILAGVTSTFLEPNMAKNMLDLAGGESPSAIYTPTFLHAFIWMGGCGTVTCLILSIFTFGKSIHTKRVAKLSLLPCVFNISEIIIFGLPVIYNPCFFIPFLLVPLACLCISSLAMQIGLVPVTSHSVEWTTPILLSGYLSTGSISGVILQIVNLTVGTLIYKPFIQRYEEREERGLKTKFDAIVRQIMEGERSGIPPSFRTDNELAETGRMLSYDLRQAIEKKQLQLYYQPQTEYDGSIYGGEALLRWFHPQLGMIYPPLIIFLAKEDGFLDELGLSLIETTCRDLEQISQELSSPIKISVNVAPQQLYSRDFCIQVQKILQKYHFGQSILAFEITEQVALSSTNEIMERLRALKNMGILLSMDDFGMGHSSVMYLQDSEFDIVKLDGNLIKKCLTSERSADIIHAITQLSLKFNFKVVAEFVETAELREKLFSLGCHIYQGWLYSPAVPLPNFIAYVRESRQKINF